MDSKVDFKKIIPIVAIVLGALIIIAVIIFAISKGTQSGTQTNSSKVEIEMWGLWEPATVMQPLIDKYQQTNPNVTIKYSQRTSTNYKDNVYGRLDETEGPGPDIFIMHSSWLPKFQKKISPATTDIMTADDMTRFFYPTVRSDLTDSSGKVYAIPLMYEGLGMFYNKDLFKKAGITTPPDDWIKFTDSATKLTQKDSAGNIKTAGAAIGTSNNVNHYFDLVSLLMMQNSVKMISEDGKTFTFYEGRGPSTLDFYIGFSKKGAANQVWSDALGNDLELFAAGKLGIMFAPSWRAFDVINLNPTLNFDIAAVPQLPSSQTTTSPTVNWSSYWAYSVSSKADNKTESWKFIKYLSESEQLKSFFSESSKIRAFGEIYSRKDIAEELKGQPYTDAFVKMAPSAIDWTMYDEVMAKQVFGEAISGKLGGDSSQESLRKAADKLTKSVAPLVSQF